MKEKIYEVAKYLMKKDGCSWNEAQKQASIMVWSDFRKLLYKRWFEHSDLNFGEALDLAKKEFFKKEFFKKEFMAQ